MHCFSVNPMFIPRIKSRLGLYSGKNYTRIYEKACFCCILCSFASCLQHGLATGALKHAKQPVQLSRRGSHFYEIFIVWNVSRFPVCLLYLLHMFLELKALQQNWVWKLMCSVDEYNMFAIVLVTISALLQRFLENILPGLVLFSW